MELSEVESRSNYKRNSNCELLQHEDLPKQESNTNWKAIYAAGILAFLSAVESTFVVMAEWPYMHTLDPEATSNFYGICSSISTAVNVIFSVVFSYWTYKSHTIKPQIIFGRILAFVGCCIYLSVEYLEKDRRYLLLFCYFIFSVAGSSTVILRGYVVFMSSGEDRTKAFSAVGVAGTVSTVVGPLGQLIFSGISYPGIQLLPNVYFNIYTAPVWMATVTNLFSIFFVILWLPELPSNKKMLIKADHRDENKQNKYSLAYIKDRWNTIKSLDVVWSLVILTFIQRIVLGLSPTTIDIIYSPLMMTIYGWDSEYMVVQSSIILATIGVVAILTCGVYMGTNISNWLSARLSFMIALLTYILMYITSYPWTFLSPDDLPQYNATTGTGCNSNEYNWCLTAKATHPLLLILVIIMVMGIGLVIGEIAIDTIYSKVLGTTDQNIMQALVVVIQNIVGIVEPIYATKIFTALGQSALWISNGLVTLFGICLWMTYYQKLKQYE